MCVKRRRRESGQAIMEYLFLIFFVIMLASGFLYQFNGAVRNLFNSYFSPDGYLACLIEKGLLPGESNDEGTCSLPTFNLASAKQYPLHVAFTNGGTSAAYAGPSGGNGAGNGATRSSESGGAGAIPYGGGGDGGAGGAGKGGAGKKDNTGNNGFSSAGGLGGGAGGTGDAHEREGYVPYTGGYEDQASTVKKKTEVPATPRDLKTQREIAMEKKAKAVAKAAESEGYDLGIGNILKWIAISLLLFAIFFFIGSQLTAVSRGEQEKPVIDINLRELYSGLLSRFDFDKVSSELLIRISAGSDKADDYEEILKKDAFFTSAVCRLASENMKHQVVNSLSHGVVVVGQDHVRDMVLGHCLERFFDPYADNSFKGVGQVEKNLKYSIRAEEHAAKCKNDYAGLAFAAGFLFDFFAMWITKQKTDPELLQGFLESTWKHSIKTASLAWALATHERVFIGHRKIIFASGILHEIGALGLALYNPPVYLKVIEKFRAQMEMNASDDGYQVAIEREFFDLSHCEIGSAIAFQTKILRDLESEVDFHHDSIVLKTRNPDAFLGTAILHIADRLAWLMDRRPNFTMEDLQEILKPHAAYFPLKSPDVMRLATEVRSKGLLNG